MTRGKIAQMVQEEAARAEAEEPDSDEDEDTEPEPEPDDEEAADEEEGGDSEAEAAPSLDAQLKKFEQENVRHEKALAKIMGDDFEAFAVCIGCGGIGFAPVVAMQYDPDLEQCERCKGHGQMLTGSVHEMYILRDCIACQGQGFTVKVTQPEAQPVSAPPVAMFDPYTGQPLPPGAQPNGGEPAGPWAPGYVPSGAPAPVAAS